MRKNGRTDANQALIVRELRNLGYTVQVLSSVGQGCPDLVIGMSGRNLLAEVKDPHQPPSKRKLTPEEKAWHENWRGQVSVIEKTEDVLKLLCMK